MRANRRVKLQLGVFAVVAVVAGAVMSFGYLKLPALLGVGQYRVTVELPRAAGLYPGSNVTYRGTTIGRVDDVRLTDAGVAAVLRLQSGVELSADVRADVHSVTALGEQYVALTPGTGTATPLKDGDVIPITRSTVPPELNALVAATNRGLAAIPREDLETAVDESFTAIGGLGPELARFVHGSAQLAIDARANLGEITALMDGFEPVADSQIRTAEPLEAWASHLATVSTQVKAHDVAVRGLLQSGPPAAAQMRQLFEQLAPGFPVLLANLVAVADVALAYQPGIEQLLVLVPQITQEFQGALVPNHNTQQDYRGAYLDFNLNMNLPPPCTTGYLPAQQRRSAALVDHPDPPEGAVYCRVPQDSTVVAVRGARNTPCATAPGKRAPTAAMCESDEQYVPLNDGGNWKGDPNATASGQPVPQLPPAAPVAVVPYDPATGSFVAPDGTVHTRADLGAGGGERTWQSMLVPGGP